MPIILPCPCPCCRAAAAAGGPHRHGRQGRGGSAGESMAEEETVEHRALTRHRPPESVLPPACACLRPAGAGTGAKPCKLTHVPRHCTACCAPLHCRFSSSTTPSPRARSSAMAPRPKQPATRAAQQPLRRRPALPAAWRALPAAGRRCSCGCGCGGQAPPAQYTRKKHSKKNTSHSTAPHSPPTLGRPRSTRLVQPASAPLAAAAAPLSAQFGRGRGSGGGSGAKLGSETAPSSAAGTTP